MADLDGDGDLDLFDGNLRTNLLRQVAWSAPARLGRPFPVEVYGPARSPYTLLCARASARIDEGARGVLRLEPATTVVVQRGVLDDEGHATVRIDVPVHASLAGEPLYVQALVGTPARYTNLELSSLEQE